MQSYIPKTFYNAIFFGKNFVKMLTYLPQTDHRQAFDSRLGLNWHFLFNLFFILTIGIKSHFINELLIFQKLV